MRSSGACLGILVSAMLARSDARAGEPPLIQPSATLPATHLTVIGSLGGTAQYRDIEEPFWARKLAVDSGGKITVDITPSDRTGLKAGEALQMARLGVISFLTVPLSAVSSEDPEAIAADLSGLNPSIEAARANLAAYRPVLVDLYRSRYGLEVLAMMTYPAQVLFCKKQFQTLTDLGGRNIRVVNATQATLVNAVGAHGVVLPFNAITSAIGQGTVECAITSADSGNSIGLPRLTHYIHALPINWGNQIVVANRAAWWGLPPELRGFLTQELAGFEQNVQDRAERMMAQGFACDTGQDDCVDGTRGDMVLVPAVDADRTLIDRILRTNVLPKWAARCGDACGLEWDRTVGSRMGLQAVVAAP
jgi:TRAP-type C4-dicarboxylate transport system substrate-binding protein